ncbi:MAG TPA: hypothetical protein VKC66_31240 [Xanthobacteraceae bacterium]|nr:hypothetical protein [Xanthobacteraceae bacterium]
MADVTVTISPPNIEAHALAIVAASVGPEQFEQACETLAQQLQGSGDL